MAYILLNRQDKKNYVNYQLKINNEYEFKLLKWLNQCYMSNFQPSSGWKLCNSFIFLVGSEIPCPNGETSETGYTPGCKSIVYKKIQLLNFF